MKRYGLKASPRMVLRLIWIGGGGCGEVGPSKIGGQLGVHVSS